MNQLKCLILQSFKLKTDSIIRRTESDDSINHEVSSKDGSLRFSDCSSDKLQDLVSMFDKETNEIVNTLDKLIQELTYSKHHTSVEVRVTQHKVGLEISVSHTKSKYVLLYLKLKHLNKVTYTITEFAITTKNGWLQNTEPSEFNKALNIIADYDDILYLKAE